MMQADLQRKQTNFAAQQANLQQMVGQGVVTQAQYIDWVHTDRAMTMQEWSSQTVTDARPPINEHMDRQRSDVRP